MGKSKAEIQRAYRERKKLREGEDYFRKERARVTGYYVPIADQSKKKANERRKKVKEAVRKHRENKYLARKESTLYERFRKKYTQEKSCV